MNDEILAMCGNRCGLCPRYVATMSGSTAELEKVAVLWYELGYRDNVVPPEEMRCSGCETADWCRYGIRECVIQKGIENCGFCGEYPCDTIEQMFESTGEFEDICRGKCGQDLWPALKEAFFEKKRNLDSSGE